MQYFSEEYLEHHGILGQKWGVRRFQNKDGSLTRAGRKRFEEAMNNKIIANGSIPKGTKLYRVTIRKNDPAFGNRKYFSLNKWDNAQWQDRWDEARAYGNKQDVKLYGVVYKTTKELKIANSKVLEEKMMSYIKNNQKSFVKQYRELLDETGYNHNQLATASRMALLFIAANKPLGNKFLNEIEKDGYGAIEDDLGRDVAFNPIIVISPDNATKRTIFTERH